MWTFLKLSLEDNTGVYLNVFNVLVIIVNIIICFIDLLILEKTKG